MLLTSIAAIFPIGVGAVEVNFGISESAQAEIDLEISRAKESLRQDVSRLALSGAEQILQKEIDENKHRDLLDNLAANL